MAPDPQAPQQQDDNAPAQLSTANQPPGTTKIENGIAYDISGKALGPANMDQQPKVDYKAIAAQMGGTPKVDYKAVAAQMGGVPSGPAKKSAPQQTYDLLTEALAAGKHYIKTGGQSMIVVDNAELAQAKNASDYIYNNVLGKNTYTHNNLTYDETPTSAAGKVWQRLWGWATQDEINKIPGLEPDRVEMLRESGNDLLSRMMGPQNAKDFRQFVEDGFTIGNAYGVPISSKVLDPVANPEVYARAAAKSLTDFFSPGYYALGAFGKVAQGYSKVAQLAADSGDMVKAVAAMSKARLLAILSTGVNVPFAASQAHDLVEHWEQMNVPERVAAAAGILGAALNAHIGIQHMGGYQQVAHDAVADTKATMQEIAQSKAAQATKKAVGSMVTLGKAQTFDEAIQRSSSLTGKKFRQQQANIKNASPELQAVAIANPNAETPGQFADSIHNWLQDREQVMLQASGGTKDSDVPVSSTLEKDVRTRLDKFFDDNRGKYGNDEQVDAAKEKILGRLLLQSKAAGAPPSLRMPNAFETENIRQGLNQEIKPQLNGEPTTHAYKAAVQQVLPILRESLDKFYDNNGIRNVKEFRAKEATMIDVADRLEAAEKRAQEMGNGSIWASLAKKFSVPTIITSIALGHNPLAFGALAPYLMGERAYQNYKNPGVNVRRAMDLAEPQAITDIDVLPRTVQGGPSSVPTQGPVQPPPMVGPSGVAHNGPPIHPTKAGQAAAAVAAATMAEPATNHVLNSQLATHFGEPLDHASLDDRIERVKNDAEAMRRSGIDIGKTQTGKMLGAINDHESEHAAKIEAEQQKAHEDAAQVVQELHAEFQKLQEENQKKIAQGGKPEAGKLEQAAFALPYETTEEELPESKYGDKSYSAVNTRMHELGHIVWSHKMGLQPFDVLSAAHEESGGAHAVARTDISRLLNPDGTNNKAAFQANLGDMVARFLAGAVAEDVHGGVPLNENTSAQTDVAQAKKLFDALEIPEADRKRITQQAVAQLREEFSKPETTEIMNAFAAKRKAGLGPEYHFDETQIHQLRRALDGKGEPDGTKETSPGLDRGARKEGGRVGEQPVAGRERGGAQDAGRLQQARQGLVERTTGDEDLDAAIRNGGGIPAGFMNVPGHGDYRMFHDPETGSTLAFKPHEAITPQTVGKKLASSREEFEAGNRREAARKAQPQKAAEVSVPPELTAGEHDKAIKEGGAIPGGIAKGDAEINVPDLVQFHDPKTGSTLALPVGEVTPENVRQELEKSRKKFAAGRKEKSVLDAAVEHYGVTDEPKKMGYILPDGRGLDFSDGQQVRTLDHGDVTEVMPTPRGENPRDRFVRETGAARFLQSSYGTEVVLPASGATPAMAETIARAIEQHPRGKKELSVDLMHTPEQFDKVAEKPGAGFASGSARGDAEDIEGVQRVINDARKDATRRQREEQAKNEKTPAEIKEMIGNRRIKVENVPHELKIVNLKDLANLEDIEGLEEQGDELTKAAIREYASQKRRGSEFPPIVLDSEGNVIDGYHRVAAASMLKDKTIAAYAPKDSVKLQPRQTAEKTQNAIAQGADDYNEKAGRPAIEASIKPHNVEYAKRVADAFDAMKHEPENPAVKKSYEAMAQEVRKQWNHAVDDMGIKFEPWTKEGQPYANSKEMVNDVRDNKHLYFFQGGDIKPESPMAKVDPEIGLSYNDMFRAVHDLFGHAAHGFEFGPKGEENAYAVHRQMFPQEAIPALTSETRGQNSWVNFGKHLRNAEGNVAKKGEPGFVPPAERPYAEQKVGLLPEEFHGKGSESEGPKGSKLPNIARLEQAASPEHQELVDKAKWEDNPTTGYRKLVVRDNSGKEVGRISHDNYRIRLSSVSDDYANQGIGKAMYEKAFEDAKKSGTDKLMSDTSLSRDADRVWQSLIRGGKYNITAEPSKEVNRGKVGNAFDDLHTQYTVHLNEPKQKDWAAGVEKAPFGGVNPNNPEAPSKTYGFEIAPEHRHNPDVLTAEEARAYAERPDVKAALAAHPDVKLGWDTTTQGPELNIGASTDDLDTAKKIAGKLDQRAIVNTSTGEEIPAGGEGKKTAFPEYPLADRLKDLNAGQLEKAKEEPKEFAENPEGFKHVSPQVLQHLEPDERAFIKDNKRAQAQIQKHYDEIKPSIDETKAAMQAGSALGGWWRRYIDAFNALGEHTNEEVASKLGPKHSDALKVWHAAVSGNKSVETANKIAWGSYADWLDKGMPRDRDSINKILADNGAVTDTHFPRSNKKKAGQVKSEGLDTTKLFRLVNSPEMRQINPSPWHGNIFDPNTPSPIYGTTSGARKIPSMGATVAGEGNLNRLVLDTHMLDYFGEKKWTDNKYLAFSAHIRQAARELGLQPGEGQEQIWGTVLGIKKLLYEGLPDSEVPDELTNGLIEGIGKDYAQIIKDDPELSNIFERLKAHGIDPGGNRAQERLAAILQGKQPAGKAPVNQTRLVESAARIRKNLKDVPEPDNTLRFNFGANALKMEQAPELSRDEKSGAYDVKLTYPDGKTFQDRVNAKSLEEAQEKGQWARQYGRNEGMKPTVEVQREVPKSELDKEKTENFYKGQEPLAKPPKEGEEVNGVYRKGVLSPENFRHASAWMLPEGHVWAQESELHSMDDAQDILPSNSVAITHGSGNKGLSVRFFGRPTDAQLSEIARLAKESDDPDVIYDFHHGFKYTPEDGSAGSIGQMRRDLEDFYGQKKK